MVADCSVVRLSGKGIQLLVFVVIACLSAPGLNAQVLYGSMLGNVTDATNAAVPRATVTLVNGGTNQKREIATDDRGAYAFGDLLEGTYDLRISAAGFMTYVKTGIRVTINTTLRIDAEMKVGQASESITVSATSTVLQTDKSDVHVDLGKQEIVNLPLTGYRNFQILTNLVPGATPAQFENAMLDTPQRSFSINVNGATRNNNTTRVDGAMNVFPQMPHNTAYIPPAETIESVSITTNSFDAEQGMAGGAAIAVSTKSGTNEFHAVVFEDHNDTAMTARNFFWIYPKKPEVVQNQYGGTFGGPIRKNKLFFFTSWEGLRLRLNAREFDTVATPAERQGDFSSLGVTLYDPGTGSSNGTGRQAFSGNMIPASRLSAIALKMQSLVPLPNQPGGSSNYFASANSVLNRDSGDLKVNWNASQKLAIWGKYSIMDALGVGQPSLGAAGGNGLISGGGTGTGHYLVQLGTIGFTNTITPTFIVDGAIGFTRIGENVRAYDYGTNYGLTVLGIPGTNGSTILQSGWPQFQISGYTTLGNSVAWEPEFRNDQDWTVTANAGWVKGAHNLRFGVDYAKFDLTQYQPEASFGDRGGFGFTGGLTDLNGGAAPNQYNAYADFLLGMANSLGTSLQSEVPMTTRDWATGLYFRDQWQATRNLTVTLGVRWEYYSTLMRAHSGYGRYDLTTNQVYVGGYGGVPSYQGNTASKRLFVPRLGVAYRWGPSMVIRAGYGITTDPVAERRALRSTTYPEVIGLTVNAPNAYSAAGTLAGGIPVPVVPNISAGVLNIPGTVSTETLNPGEFKRGYIESFNFTLQRQLPGSFVAQAGYVGTRAIRTAATYDMNAGLIPGAGVSGQPLYQAFGRTATTLVLLPWQTMNYNSLQMRLDRRFTGGLMMGWAYTYSKCIDYLDNSGESSPLFYAPSQLARNRSVCGYDRTQNLQMSSVYVLPFGKGQRYFHDGRFAPAFFGGWQTNAVFSSYTGLPFSVTASSASLNAPANTQTADQVEPNVAILGGVGNGSTFFDTTAFAPITTARYGNTGRNILRGPGAINMSLGLFRTFKLTERMDLQFRGECFNVANTPHFALPAASASSSSFGHITATAGNAGEDDARFFRLSLRLSF